MGRRIAPFGSRRNATTYGLIYLYVGSSPYSRTALNPTMVLNELATKYFRLPRTSTIL